VEGDLEVREKCQKGDALEGGNPGWYNGERLLESTFEKLSGFCHPGGQHRHFVGRFRHKGSTAGKHSLVALGDQERRSNEYTGQPRNGAKQTKRGKTPRNRRRRRESKMQGSTKKSRGAKVGKLLRKF